MYLFIYLLYKFIWRKNRFLFEWEICIKKKNKKVYVVLDSMSFCEK